MKNIKFLLIFTLFIMPFSVVYAKKNNQKKSNETTLVNIPSIQPIAENINTIEEIVNVAENLAAELPEEIVQNIVQEEILRHSYDNVNNNEYKEDDYYYAEEKEEDDSIDEQKNLEEAIRENYREIYGDNLPDYAEQEMHIEIYKSRL